jgi:hypothetical protein
MAESKPVLSSLPHAKDKKVKLEKDKNLEEQNAQRDE